MSNKNTKNYKEIFLKQKNFFNKENTKSYEFRIKSLRTLIKLIDENEDKIITALNLDLKKPEFETYLTEIVATKSEIKFAIKNLKDWMRDKKIKTPLTYPISKSYIKYEPYGISLIISPWNYPFQLLISPLVGSIAAGNCSILKPSEITMNTSKLLKELFDKYFNDEYIFVIEGDANTTQLLLDLQFDYIFFTGGTNIGKIVYQKAAEKLIPVTLELGGKSPCILDKDCNLKRSIRTIVWGKFVNTGQTCIAPDYLLIHKSIKKQAIELLKIEIENFYSNKPEESKNYGRIVNEKHFLRLKSYLDNSKIIYGGKTIEDQKYIQPTLVEVENYKSKIMNEEIFGPILPILEFKSLDEEINRLKEFEKPLALYYFSKNKSTQEKIISKTTSGGVCINDTILQVGNNNLPFGGVGSSGIGNYHGKYSFDTFSHKKSVVKASYLFELKIRYPPYKDLSKIKNLIKNLI